MVGQRGFSGAKADAEGAALRQTLEPWRNTGRCVIAAARRTQRETARHILDHGLHDILTVKGNQPQLLAQLRDDYRWTVAGHGQPPAAPEQRPDSGGGGVRGGHLRRSGGATGGRGAPARGNPLAEPRARGRTERPGLAHPPVTQGSKPSNKHRSSLADPNIEFAWSGD